MLSTVVKSASRRLHCTIAIAIRTFKMSARASVKLQWDLSPLAIEEKTKELMAQSRSVFDEVGDLSPSEVTFENSIKPLADNLTHFDTTSSMLRFPQHVSTDKVLRDASTEAARKLAEFSVEMQMRQDVFRNVVSFKESNKSPLSAEAQRFVDRLVIQGKRRGLHLSEDVQQQVKAIKKQLSDLCITFGRNINEEKTTLLFTPTELGGLPQDFMDSLQKGEDGKLKVTLKYPHYYPCMKKATKTETRQKLEAAFTSRCVKENTMILEEIIELRQKQATLLGYSTHADYVTELRMAGNAASVEKFLLELSAKLTPLAEKEMKILLDYKAEECREQGVKNDGVINPYDFRFYLNMVEERQYSIDQQKIKEYFPLEKVTKGLLSIYQDLLGLVFTEETEPNAWHEDVRLYQVTDSKSEELLGYFYLDLHPREGKFSHAACFDLQAGCRLPDGQRQPAVAAMVANFTEQPSLLTHDEVETYFHEFGHVMHHICADQSDYTMFSGMNVEQDFVEAPSQMLQNWCWEKEPLHRMSGHFETGEPLPDEMVEKLVAARNANAGLLNKRQLHFAIFDQQIHSASGKVDTAAVYSKLSKEIAQIDSTPGTNMAASFGHLAGGYDAQYYGYLWSDVFSMDMFYSRFKKEGIMSPAVGLEYRNCILGPGGSKDAKDMLREFLGREPTQEAFLMSKGLSL